MRTSICLKEFFFQKSAKKKSWKTTLFFHKKKNIFSEPPLLSFLSFYLFVDRSLLFVSPLPASSPLFFEVNCTSPCSTLTVLSSPSHFWTHLPFLFDPSFSFFQPTSSSFHFLLFFRFLPLVWNSLFSLSSCFKTSFFEQSLEVFFNRVFLVSSTKRRHFRKKFQKEFKKKKISTGTLFTKAFSCAKKFNIFQTKIRRGSFPEKTK